MRAALRVTALSITCALAACSGHEETATRPGVQNRATTPDLAAAPSTYTRMRFVSAIEQARLQGHSVPQAKRGHSGSTIHESAVRDPLASLASTQPALVSVVLAVVDAPAPAMNLSAPVAPEPPRMMTVGVMEGDGGMMDHGGEGERYRPSVVIRGGSPGNGKCDPRTDTHTTPREIGRPDFAMPSPVGRSVFGGRQR